jgi:hypothetical protein
LAKKKYQNFRIEKADKALSQIVDARSIGSGVDGKTNVSLKYYQRSHQCLSDWQKDEIKRFSGWLEKVRERTPSQIKSTTLTCHKHLGKKKKPLPSGLSPDLECYGLDVGDKQRIHGAFVDETFFVIWLDREHNFLD